MCLISAFRAVFGSLFHTTHHFGRKNYFNKVTGALCQNNFLTNLFNPTRHSERSEESLKKISKPHDCIPFNTGKILKQVQDDSTTYVDTLGFARILEGVTHFLTNLFHITRHSERSGATHVDTLGLPSIRHPEALDEGATHISMSNNNRRAAFTLAEVLITLGIIGVVAALTIPNLIHIYNSIVLKSQLKKTYSVLSGAVNMIHAQTGLPVTPERYSVPLSFYRELMKYVKVAKDCGNSGCTDINDVYRLENYQNFNFTAQLSYALFDDGQLILQDGTFLMFENLGGENGVILITADINGINKGPNAMGHDLFSFQVLDNELVPSGADASRYNLKTYPDYCSHSGNSNFNGIACTYKALKDPDYFKNLPKP